MSSEPQPKVLIVDDQARNLDALEVMLAPLDCATVRAESADAALLALLKDDFAAMVIDVRMPGTDGIELARLVKERKRSQNVPLLFLTAHRLEEADVLQAYGVGASDYLTKPLNAEILRSKVGILLDVYRHSQAMAALNRALENEVRERQRTQRELEAANQQQLANEERLAFLLRLNDALRPLGDAGEVQETAARLLGEHLGANRVAYAEFTGENKYTIHRDYARGLPSLAGQAPRLMLNNQIAEAFRRGETVVIDDYRTDPRLREGDHAILKERQIAAFIVAPLLKDGRMLGSLGVNQVTPRVWTKAEVGLVRDVAERTWDAVERTRAEAAMRDQKHRLRVALEASAGGSWTWVRSTNQVDWDQRFRSLYGFTPDEPATTDGWVPRVHDDDRPRLLASLEEILTSKTKDSWENTFRIIRPDGTEAWIQSRGRAERDADGTIIRMSGLDLDFNQHRQAEVASQARRDEQHDRALRTLLETAAQGIVSVDGGGMILTANRALEAMFGWATGELAGQPIERLLPYVTAPRPRLIGGGFEPVGQRKDGSTFPIEVSMNQVQTEAGVRTFSFITDITERQRAAAALQQRTAELEDRTTQLRRMASDLTLAEQHAREQIAKTLHDGLQQLLVIAALNVDQALKRDRDRGHEPGELLAEARHHLDEAITAARSLNIELYPPVLHRAGLPAALAWLAEWGRDKYKVDVQVTADPRADSARKDVRTLLFESVRELLFNAVKHAQADRVSLDLSLDAGDQLCITVSDQGIGFEPEGLDYRSNGQVGWGLFSIRERLTLLGGSFDIDSAPGQGTRVRLVAPRGDPQRTAAAAPSTPSGATLMGGEREASQDALRILLVDDHAPLRGAFRDILNQLPQLSVVGEAANGLEAITQAHALRPDVILMDVSMPHMDGIEATKRIHAERPHITIFGLSMQPRSAAAEAIEEAGAAGFFVKGFDMQRLIEQLLLVHASRVADNSRA